MNREPITAEELAELDASYHNSNGAYGWRQIGTQVRTMDGLYIAECGPADLNGAGADAWWIAKVTTLYPRLRAALAALGEASGS